MPNSQCVSAGHQYLSAHPHTEREAGRKRKGESLCVLTSTPYKIMLEDKKQYVKRPLMKKLNLQENDKNQKQRSQKQKKQNQQQQQNQKQKQMQ